ncbi:aminotransferase class I/II-fold pyridoxal phosphate-dependent enzyme [Pajaroellobacter abortibovis]|nr:aminotransferase class I/II-fold pyridoxal phosphate-dependent enzyme [Pajaroellobacter abortibovis]
MNVPSDHLLLTQGRGMDEGIELLIRAFCVSSLDAVVTTPPAFGYYSVAAEIAGIQVRSISLQEEEGFTFHPERLLAAWSPSIKVIFLCTPNNPTGNCIPPRVICSLCEALEVRAS